MTVAPRAPIPGWLPGAMAALRQRRDELQHRHESYEHARRRAGDQLADLQPVLAAAREAWRPYAERINAITADLDHNLRPAMWAANREADHARFGHRHAARRHVADATQAVADAQARIDDINADGAEIKQRFDALTTRAAALGDHADQHGGRAILDRYTRHDLHRTARVFDALGAWQQWASGQPVPTASLPATVETLAEAAAQAPLISHRGTEVTRARYTELLTGLEAPIRQLGLDDEIGRRLADIGRDAPGIGR